jgi:hypothetical protein
MQQQQAEALEQRMSHWRSGNEYASLQCLLQPSIRLLQPFNKQVLHAARATSYTNAPCTKVAWQLAGRCQRYMETSSVCRQQEGSTHIRSMLHTVQLKMAKKRGHYRHPKHRKPWMKQSCLTAWQSSPSRPDGNLAHAGDGKHNERDVSWRVSARGIAVWQPNNYPTKPAGVLGYASEGCQHSTAPTGKAATACLTIRNPRQPSPAHTARHHT